MNILLIGGPSSFINNIIIKLNKEGHRIYLLTGNKFKQVPYQKVFESYNFSYDSQCLNEIFESISDKTLSTEEKLKEFVGHTKLQVFMGALLGIGIAILLG